MTYSSDQALLASLLNQLPQAHREMLEACQINFGADEIGIHVDSTRSESGEIVDELKLAEWSIGSAISNVGGLPDCFTIYVDTVPRKRFQASQAIRKTKMRLQQAEDSLGGD